MVNSRRNIICSIILLIFGISIFFLAQVVIKGGGEGLFDVDAKFFPRFLAVLLILLSLIYLISSIKEYRDEARKEDEEGKVVWMDEVRSLIVFLIMIFYAVTFNLLGYFITTFISTTSVLITLGVRKKHLYLIVYCIAGVIYVIFKYFLNVQLP